MKNLEMINSLKNSYINFATLCDAFRRYELYNSVEARNIIDLYAKNIEVFPLPVQNMWGNALAVSFYTHHYKSALYMLNKNDELNLNLLSVSAEGRVDEDLTLVLRILSIFGDVKEKTLDADIHLYCRNLRNKQQLERERVEREHEEYFSFLHNQAKEREKIIRDYYNSRDDLRNFVLQLTKKKR